MARQKKRADGRFMKYTKCNGKRYYVYGRTKDEVDEKLNELKEKLKKGIQDHDDPTLDSFHVRWTENRRDSIKESTLRCQHFQYNSCADVLINGKRLGDYRLSEIKADDIRQVQKALQNSEKKNRTQTINDKIAVLSHIFHDALVERYIDYNPCVAVKPLKRTEERARDTIHRALTIDEQQTFFQNAEKSYYYDVFRMAILTGMRIGEIGALYQSDIYDDAIHIARTITKTETGGYQIGEDTKTIHGKRTIPLNDQIREVIDHQKQINKMLDGDKIVAMNSPIFKAPERGLLMATPLDREIGRICKRTGIEKFTAHAFRATFATRCIEQGIEPRTLQELLGHADFGITMNLYGHVTDNTLETAMNSLSIAL
ncbi:MAG: site-specific integrase [Lachnospiraceae bacterium]|nr:site-specific integrase [Lachnospiraceae bacterium]